MGSLTRIRGDGRYYTDPYLYNCKYDPVQDAIYVAESRAIAYAISKGVMVVAAGASSSLSRTSHPAQIPGVYAQRSFELTPS